MQPRERIGALVLIATAGAASVGAQTTLDWRSWAPGDGGGDCAVVALAVDPSGAIYTVEAGACELDERADLRRREPDGTLTWTRRLPALLLGGLELAPDGDVVVFGRTTRAPERFVVLRGAGTGAARWAHSEFGPKLTSVAFDAQGTLYLAGSSQADLWLRALSPDGSTAWDATFDGPAHGSDSASDVATDPFGDVFLVGSVSSASGKPDATIRKLSPDGQTLWERSFGYAQDSETYVRVVSDRAGGAFVGGSAAFVQYGWPPQSRVVAFGAHYDASGTHGGGFDAVAWSGDSSVRDLCVDPSGEAWIAVLSDQPPTHWGTRLAVVRLASDGPSQSVFQYVPVSGESWPGNLMLDVDGSVLASGAQGDYFGAAANTTVLLRFAAEGTPAWIQTFGSPTSGLGATLAACAPNGRVVLAGSAGVSTKQDTAVVMQVALHDGPWRAP